MSSREEIDRAIETSLAYMRIPGKYENYVFLCKKNGQIPLSMEELRKSTYKRFGVILREPPEICPVCSNVVKKYESGRVLCENRLCDFEWYSKPFVKLPNKLPLESIERLKRPSLTNTETLCYLLGWQGGTIHQLSRTIGFSVSSILNAKDVRGLLSAVADLAV